MKFRKRLFNNFAYFRSICLDFREHCTDFTRKRKFDEMDVFFFILSRIGVSIAMELHRYFKAKGVDETMSDTALFNQRMKLKPEVFIALTNRYNRDFYADKKIVKMIKHHLLIAIDGTDLTLPTTPDLIDKYGHSQGKPTDRITAMATMSCAYDVLNRMFLDADFGRYRRNERTMALGHLKKIESRMKEKKIYVMDRGYFSYSMIYYMQGVKYVMRLKKGVLKEEIEKMKGTDGYITIDLKGKWDTQRDAEVKKWMEETQRWQVRITKIKLTTGETEYLLSNLGEDFTEEEIGEIYRRRWGEETAFNILKHHLKLEDFSGVTQRLIEQDVYSTIYLSNIVQDMWQELQREVKQEGYTHEMRINRNIEIGIWKTEMIEIMSGDMRKYTKKMKGLMEKIEKHLVPVRPGESNERKKEKKPRKHHQNQKHSY